MAPPLLITGLAPQRASERLPQIHLGRPRAQRWRNSSSGGLRHRPESPGYLYQGRSAVPTSGQRQVPSEDSFINFETEAGDGDAPQHPSPGGSLTVRSVTTGSAVGGPLQHADVTLAALS